MEKEKPVMYYVTYHAIIRLGKFLEERDIFIPKNIKNEIKKCENFFTTKENIDLIQLNKLIDNSVKDEQDLGFKEMLYQQYLYSLSDFSYFFIEEDIDFLFGSLDTIIETYRFFVMNDYFVKNNISSLDWDEQYEYIIEESNVIIDEKQKQLNDEKYARQNL